MVSYSNKFVLIRSKGRGSVGKQLVLRTAFTHHLLVKAPSWLHWNWLLKRRGCTATTKCSVIVSRAGLKGRGARGSFYRRAPKTRFMTSSFVKVMFSLIRKVPVFSGSRERA